MIDKQYSPTVAAAQVAGKLDAFAADLLQGISGYTLPEPLLNTGLRISLETNQQLLVQAHGKTVKSSFEHIWLKDSLPFGRLGGRIQFWSQDKSSKDDSMLYEILFDELGNARLGDEEYFSNSIRKDMPEFQSALRQIALGVVNAIHGVLDSVECRI